MSDRSTSGTTRLEGSTDGDPSSGAIGDGLRSLQQLAGSILTLPLSIVDEAIKSVSGKSADDKPLSHAPMPFDRPSSTPEPSPDPEFSGALVKPILHVADVAADLADSVGTALEGRDKPGYSDGSGGARASLAAPAYLARDLIQTFRRGVSDTERRLRPRGRR